MFLNKGAKNKQDLLFFKENKGLFGQSCLPHYKQFFSKFLDKEINILGTRILLL